jgi:hypothetical protein
MMPCALIEARQFLERAGIHSGARLVFARLHRRYGERALMSWIDSDGVAGEKGVETAAEALEFWRCVIMPPRVV